MSLLRNAFNGLARIRAEVSGTPAPWDDFWYYPIGAPSASGMRVTPDSAKRIGAVIACVNKIAKTVAMLPLKMYMQDANGGKTQATGHPLFDVLHTQPNELQTSFEFRQMMQGHLELRGNAYAEILPGPRGVVDQLMPMHPDRVTPQRLRDGSVRYRYNDPLTNQDRYLRAEEVFHLRNFMDDGVEGQSTVAMGIDVFGTALAAQDYYARFLKNDSRPPIVLTGANFKTKQDKDEFRQSWQDSQTGSNRYKAAVLPTGMDVKTIGVSGRDAELLDARKFSRIDIASLFDIPPHIIGEVEKTATYASVEQFNILFATFCIMPRLVLWEQAIQRSLITSARYFAKFSMGSLLRGDTAARFGAYKVAIENGWMSQNDVRIQEDMNPIADGDNYWRPLNWARLGDIHTSVQQTETPEGTESEENVEPTTARPSAKRVFQLVACAAEPCVRKEVNALRKMYERFADLPTFRAQVSDFYRRHAVFLAERMKLPLAVAREYCDEHARVLLATGDVPGCLDSMLALGITELGRKVTEKVQ